MRRVQHGLVSRWRFGRRFFTSRPQDQSLCQHFQVSNFLFDSQFCWLVGAILASFSCWFAVLLACAGALGCCRLSSREFKFQFCARAIGICVSIFDFFRLARSSTGQLEQRLRRVSSWIAGLWVSAGTERLLDLFPFSRWQNLGGD